jgi:5-methylcytosine-specific restriction endonuclease McrA
MASKTSKKSKVTDSSSLEKEIAKEVSALAVKHATFDTLKEEAKELEERVTTNKVAVKSIKEEIKTMTDKIDELKKKQKQIEEEERIEREAEEKLRKEIETKVREEMEIKKKVDEELVRLKKIEVKPKKKDVEPKKKDVELKKKDTDQVPIPGEESATEPVAPIVPVVPVAPVITPVTKRKAIPKAVKSTLWNMHFTENNAKGDCQVCTKEIKMNDFEAGHIIAASNGGSDNLDNLLPICGLCNRSMGTQNLNEFKKMYFEKAAIVESK